MMTDKERLFLGYLATEGYRDLKLLPGDRWAATFRFIFTEAIIVGRMFNPYDYEDRWCYSPGHAAAALDAWNGDGEPTGWHRHPDTGRRVAADGAEYVMP